MVAITAANRRQSRQAAVSQRLKALLIIDLLIKHPFSLVQITASTIITNYKIIKQGVKPSYTVVATSPPTYIPFFYTASEMNTVHPAHSI